MLAGFVYNLNHSLQIVKHFNFSLENKKKNVERKRAQKVNFIPAQLIYIKYFIMYKKKKVQKVRYYRKIKMKRYKMESKVKNRRSKACKKKTSSIKYNSLI